MTLDEQKNKAQLIEELVELRARCADLEGASEAALLESEERHRALFETMTQGVVYQDAQGNITSANPAAQRILGLTLDQMCGRTSLDPRWKAVREDGSDFPGDEHPAMVSLRTGAPEQGAVMGVYCPKENTQRWISIDSVPLFREGEGRPFQVYATFTDITERRQAEQDRRASELRYRAVSELTSDYAYCFRVEPDGALANEWVTGALDRVTGYSREELHAAGGWTHLIHSDDMSIPTGQLEALLSNQAQSVEYRVVTKNGEIRWVRDSARPIWDSKECRVTRIEGAGKDITEIKEAEHDRLDLQLRVQQAQKQESLGTLAGGIAHDFNNLLMGVLGNAELALSNLPPASAARGDIESVRQAATRAADLANQMLAYSGNGHFVKETLSLSDVTASMGHLLEAALPKTTGLDYQLDEQIPTVEGDKTQIRQMIMNFVTNASEALEAQTGVIKVNTGTMAFESASDTATALANECADGTYAFLEVADNGIGMDEETVSKIFDPFFTTKFIGRGLGLAAAFGIVRGHRGLIKVDSALGEGTTIRALFPVAEPPAKPRGEFESAAAGVALGDTVLLVDDDPGVVEVGTRMLAMAGYQVKTARDGYEAVEVFKRYADDIACVILDLTMPKMGGEQTFVELKKIRDDVPVLLSSGYTVEEVEARVSMGSFAGFIKKPYTMDELTRYVRGVLKAS